jgi:hypothetical protein
MAISTTAGSFFNDNMMTNTNTSGRSYEREMYEREMQYRRQEEEYRRMQAWAITSTGHQPTTDFFLKSDPNDPLAFLKKADNKLLITGETS